MKSTLVSLIESLTKFVVALSFMIVIFAATGVPLSHHPQGIIDFLVSSPVSRMTAAGVMTAVFGWLLCFNAKPFWRRFSESAR